MYISHSVMDRLGVKATNSKARGVKAKAKDTPAGLEAPRGQGRGLEDSISEIWYVGRGRWVMHDGMPYGRNQGQGQGHSREVDRQSPTGLIFYY